MDRSPPGLFVVGTDTDVGKTHVAAMIARALCAAGLRTGVYKPVASGCSLQGGQPISDDAVTLWNAAKRPGAFEDVCPQRFAAPLAPHLAARAAGQTVDARLLRDGLQPWLRMSDMIVVEGAGGLLSPVTDDETVADLAADFGFPLVVVARNALGAMHAALATVLAARQHGGLSVAGIVLNQTSGQGDASVATNAAEIHRRAGVPLLAEVRFGQTEFQPSIDWRAAAMSLRA